MVRAHLGQDPAPPGRRRPGQRPRTGPPPARPAEARRSRRCSSQGAARRGAAARDAGRGRRASPPVDLSRVHPDSAAVEAAAQGDCASSTASCRSRKNGDILTIAVCDPFDVLLLDDLRQPVELPGPAGPVAPRRHQARHRARCSTARARPMVQALLDEVAGAAASIDVEDEQDEDIEMRRRSRARTRRRSSWST